MAENDKFHWEDYLVFSVSLAIAVLVGIIVAIKDKWHKQSKESYLMANRRMNWLFVGLSFLNTFIAGFLFVPMPTEFYYYGDGFLFDALSLLIAGIIPVIFVVPKFYRLGFLVTSAYEYLQHRFNLPLRMMIGFIYMILSTLNMGIVLYSASLVLEKVSALNIGWSITIGALVCIIYAAFGGMKAVIFVDSIQVIIIMAGMSVLAAKGITDAGGMKKSWELYAVQGQRNNWRDLNPEPWNRHSLWNVIFLIGMQIISVFVGEQAILQRIMTVRSMRQSQLSVILGVLLMMPIVALSFFIGLAAFVNLGGNEPLLNGNIERQDQIVPYFLMYLLGNLHGLPGLFVAALYAATLSTVSSFQNALVAVILEDIVQPIHKMRTKNNLSEKVAGIVAKILGIVVGLAGLGMTFLVSNISGSLLELTVIIYTLFYGPMLGLMMCGFFLFWVEAWGAMVGFLVTAVWGAFLSFSSLIYANGLGMDMRPLFLDNYTQQIEFPNPTDEPTLFDVSYTWYTLLDMLIMMIVSTVISLIVHCCRHGRLRASDMMPDKAFLYTTEDFLVAIGCRKNEQDSTDNDDADTIKKEVMILDGPYINLAFEETRL